MLMMRSRMWKLFLNYVLYAYMAVGSTLTYPFANDTLSNSHSLAPEPMTRLPPSPNGSIEEVEALFATQYAAVLASVRSHKSILPQDLVQAWDTLKVLRPAFFNCSYALNRTLELDGREWSPTVYNAAGCCDEMKNRWAQVSSTFSIYQSKNLHQIYYTMSEIRAITAVNGTCSGPFTTLCDGVPRALCTPGSSSMTFHLGNWVEASSIKTATGSIVPFPLPPPQCSLNEEQCSRLWESWFTSRTSILREETWPITRTILQPVCSLKGGLEKTYFPCGFAYNVKLLYWPPKIDEDYLCGNHTAVSVQDIPEPGPRTAVFKGWTLTSPTAYVFFPTMRHNDGLGAVHTNILLPVEDGSIQTEFNPNFYSELADSSYSEFKNSLHTTRRETNGGSEAKRMKDSLVFADLVYKTVGNLSFPLVPASKYMRQEKCIAIGATCRKIYHDYERVIVFKVPPEAIQKIDPAWSKCGYEYLAAHDPPYSLIPDPASHPSVPTMPSLPSNSPPGVQGGVRPGASPSPPLPTQTTHDSFSGTVNPPPHNQPGALRPSISRVTVLASPTPSFQHPFNGYRAPFLFGLSPNDGEFPIQNNQPPNLPAIFGPGSPPDPSPHQTRAVFIVSGKPITAILLGSGMFVMGGTTFSSNGVPATTHGVTVSAFGSGVIIEGEGILIPSDSNQGPAQPSSRRLGDPKSGKGESKVQPAGSNGSGRLAVDTYWAVSLMVLVTGILS